MEIRKIDSFFRNILPLDDLKSIDNSQNGLQVENKSKTAERIAFAVDASLSSFERAVSCRADMLFVHHGLFWGHETVLTGIFFERIRFLIENNLSLYAVHLPLDMDEKLGNNITVAGKCGLTELEPFGEYHGRKIGYRGIFRQPVSCEEVIDRLGYSRESLLSVLDFGPELIKSAGVITGGASREVEQAAAEKLDLYITGEISHQIYHQCLEAGINVISAGHYQTETYGVKNVMKAVEAQLGLETVFLDIPTGL